MRFVYFKQIKKSKLMKKKIIFLLSLILLSSCKDKTEQAESPITNNKKENYPNKKNTEPKPEVSVERDDNFEILIPKEYRDFGKENEVN